MLLLLLLLLLLFMMMFVRFVLGETSKEKELRRGQNNNYTLQKNIRQD